jgi:hypothetical protein
VLVPPARRDPELPGEDRCIHLGLVVAEARNLVDAGGEFLRRDDPVPECGRVTSVRLDDEHGNGLNPLCHIRRKAMYRRRSSKDGFDFRGVAFGDRRRRERTSKAFLDDGGPSERLLDGNLLVQGHADQEGKRVRCKEIVCTDLGGEVERSHVETVVATGKGIEAPSSRSGERPVGFGTMDSRTR